MVSEKSNYHLLSDLISNSSKVEQLLNQYSHNFYLLTRATREDLLNVGLTVKESNRIISAFEIFKRALCQTEVKKVSNSSHSFELLKDLSFSKVEVFSVIFLDKANQVITILKMFKGGLCETSVDVKIIYKKAIDLGATSIICGHNHPSGNRNPSNNDINLCHHIKNASKLIQINFLDFIIIAKNDYLSFQIKA